MNIQGGNMVSRIKQLSSRIFERILSEQNIDAFNGAQGRILYVLWQEENISLKELSDRTGLAATTLTSMVDRMESSGLVCRVPDQRDRRKTLLLLTEKARSLEVDYMAVSGQMSEIFYAGFSDEEIRLCEAMLERIYENLKLHDQIIRW
ncbi:MAG: MarR family transcriptional regulator [Dorea sp.]|nr:MarR family transcriptional regulator [Dorea sp.]